MVIPREQFKPDVCSVVEFVHVDIFFPHWNSMPSLGSPCKPPTHSVMKAKAGEGIVVSFCLQVVNERNMCMGFMENDRYFLCLGKYGDNISLQQLFTISQECCRMFPAVSSYMLSQLPSSWIVQNLHMRRQNCRGEQGNENAATVHYDCSTLGNLWFMTLRLQF